MKKPASCTFLFLFIAFLNLSSFAQPKLWGTLPRGGNTESGAVYEINAQSNSFNLVYSFHKYNGEKTRADLLLADNGKFYGIAEGGYGLYGSIIYEYDPLTDEFSIVHDFYDPLSTLNLSAQGGSLMQASNGKIYGCTQTGGLYNDGQLFEFNPDNHTCNVKIEFKADATGKKPVGTLCQASNGKFYGVTREGGDHGYGVLYAYDPGMNNLTALISFDEINYGRGPAEGVIQTSNGLLFGMTESGGASLQGVIYSYETGSGIFSVKHDFNMSASGANPYGKLFQASDGLLYGMTSTGGMHGFGVLFRYNPNQQVFYKLLDLNGVNGANPTASLIQHGDFLYGMTNGGGVSDEGVLFRYDLINATIFKLQDFYGEDYGKYPYGSLSFGPDGNLYGTTYSGGNTWSSSGILFMYDPESNIFTRKFDFMKALNGDRPKGDLLMADNGLIYGTTYAGGTVQSGTIYRINPDDFSQEVLYDFDYYKNGGLPAGGLMQAQNGLMYGMADNGINMDGIIYVFDPGNNDFSVLFNFDEPVSGEMPEGRLLQASNGKLYGHTLLGGTHDDGVLFSWDITGNTFAKLFDFDETTSGKSPRGTPVQAANGKLYGVTNDGGLYDKGVLYEYDIASANYTRKINFDGTNQGAYPMGTLMEFGNNQLYGMCIRGGLYDEGVLYKYDAENGVFTRLINFDGAAMGGRSSGSLMAASNNKIYGCNHFGGAHNFGVVFEYDPAENTYRVLYDFKNPGETQSYGALIEVDSDFGIIDNDSETTQIIIFPNPVSSQLTISSDISGNNVHLTIIDISGKEVYGQTYMQHEKSEFIKTLTLNGLERGVYFVRLTSGGNAVFQKFVVF